MSDIELQSISNWTHGRILRHPYQAMTEMMATIRYLEAGLQESRQLNKRLAEVIDVLAEVMLPPEQRDEARRRANSHACWRSSGSPGSST